MIYIDEPYLKLEWDEINRIVVADWHGFFTSEKFRAGLLKGLEVIAQYHAANWLADTTEAKVTAIADQNYLAYEWTSLAMERGLRRIAYIVPTDIIAQMALNRIVNETKGLEIKYFSNRDEARQWLVSFPAQTNQE